MIKNLQYRDIPCVPEKAGPEKYWQIWRYATKFFEQRSLVYIFNCHIVYLSLAKKKKQDWFLLSSFQDVTSKVNLHTEPFL